MGKQEKGEEILLNYIKTSSYRTYHVDGAFGGLTPKNCLYMELFIERLVTPQTIKYKITDNGKLGNEINREGKSGLTREIECGIIMDMETARSVRDWLNEKIDEHKDRIKTLKEMREKNE